MVKNLDNLKNEFWSLSDQGGLIGGKKKLNGLLRRGPAEDLKAGLIVEVMEEGERVEEESIRRLKEVVERVVEGQRVGLEEIRKWLKTGEDYVFAEDPVCETEDRNSENTTDLPIQQLKKSITHLSYSTPYFSLLSPLLS